MATKPSKKFVKEMEKMYPSGATISPKKPKKPVKPMSEAGMSKKKPKKQGY